MSHCDLRFLTREAGSQLALLGGAAHESSRQRSTDTKHVVARKRVPASDRVVALEIVRQHPVRAAPRVRQRHDVLLRHVLRDPDRLEQLHAVVLVGQHLRSGARHVKRDDAARRYTAILHVGVAAHVVEGLSVSDVKLRGPLAVPLACGVPAASLEASLPVLIIATNGS